MRTPERERLAAVETALQGLRIEVREIHDDVKTLLAAHNQHSGASRLAAALWAGLLGLGGAIGGALIERGHR